MIVSQLSKSIATKLKREGGKGGRKGDENKGLARSIFRERFFVHWEWKKERKSVMDAFEDA